MSTKQLNELREAAATIERLADETKSDALCWAALDLKSIEATERKRQNSRISI